MTNENIVDAEKTAIAVDALSGEVYIGDRFPKDVLIVSMGKPVAVHESDKSESVVSISGEVVVTP